MQQGIKRKQSKFSRQIWKPAHSHLQISKHKRKPCEFIKPPQTQPKAGLSRKLLQGFLTCTLKRLGWYSLRFRLENLCVVMKTGHSLHQRGFHHASSWTNQKPSVCLHTRNTCISLIGCVSKWKKVLHPNTNHCPLTWHGRLKRFSSRRSESKRMSNQIWSSADLSSSTSNQNTSRTMRAGFRWFALPISFKKREAGMD